MTPILAHLAVDFLFIGGLWMWPLLACLFAALFVVAERALWWLGLNKRCQSEALEQAFASISQGDFDGAVNRAARTDDPYLLTVREGLCWAPCNCARVTNSS